MTAPTYTVRTYSRAAVRLHGSLTYGVLSQPVHSARMRLLLAVRRIVQEVLAMLDEDLDDTAAEWKRDGGTLGEIGAATGLARSTVQGHVQRGDERRDSETAAAVQLGDSELACATAAGTA